MGFFFATKITNGTKDGVLQLRVLRDLRGKKIVKAAVVLWSACLAAIALSSDHVRGQNLAGVVAPPPPRVTRIDIDFDNGGTEENRRTIRDLLLVRVGDEYSAGKLRDSLIRLYESGRVSNVQAFMRDDTDGDKALTLRVTRQVRVKEVLVDEATVGPRVFTSEELRPRLAGLENGAKYVERPVTQGLATILDAYRERGYFQAQVVPSVSDLDPDARVTVTYRVVPGTRATVGTRTFEGTIKLDRAMIEAKADKTRSGEPYTAEAVAADTQRIRQLHLEKLYLNPTISVIPAYDEATNRMNLTFAVTSGPVVDVKVEGYDIGESDRRTIFRLLREGGLDDFVIEDGQRELLNFMQRQGYFFADVSSEPYITPETATITYRVEKNQRYRVAAINLLGTDRLNVVTLAPELASRIAGPVPRSRGLATLATIEQDAGLIERKLKDMGYRQAKVTERRLGVTPNNQNLEVTFVVTEGPRQLVRDTTFSGNKVFTTEELRARLPIRDPNLDYLTESHVREDLDRLYGMYEEAGYADIQITPQLETDADGTGAKLRYEIVEGPRIRINRITVTTRGRTSRRLITSYLPFKDGDFLQRGKLSQAEQILYATGAFRQVIIRTEKVSGDDHEALHDVFVDVTESNPYIITYGFGYQQDDSPRGSFEITNNNVRGTLQVASLAFRLSRREQLGQLSYQLPRPFGYQLPALASAFYQRLQQASFSSERFTSLLQVQKPLTPESSLFFRYTFERVRAFDLQISGGDLQRNDQPVTLGRFSLSYVRNTRDSVLEATTGSLTIGDVSVASTAFGGSERFVKVFGQHARFYKLPKFPSIVVAGSARVGLARPFGGSDSLPISERFFTGGSTNLRGFGFEQAGPRDPNTDQPSGGNSLIVLNAELRYPILWRIGGAAFYDTGNVFRKVSDVNFGNFTNTIGTGLRFQTPVGPVRIDFGYLVNPPFYVATPGRRLPQYRFQFGIGQAF